jgi:ADP-heptose:LPS heptosyltransferase
MVAERIPAATLAPPTGLWELAHLLNAARAVVTCDTGPMHLSVAVGTPTCGIFVSTPPPRYGYPDAPHAAVDAREREHDAWLAEVGSWLSSI